MLRLCGYSLFPKHLISLLSPLVGPNLNLCFTDSPSVLRIDSGHDWTQLNASQVLWRSNDENGSVYIVINGRLHALIDQDNRGVSIVGEYGRSRTQHR